MRVFAVVAGVVLVVGVTALTGTAPGRVVGVQGDDEVQEYEVQPGVTLWGIAASELGDPYRWSEIAAGVGVDRRAPVACA